uniref:Interferon induced protein with tetratricopeptide repeats 3 n=1 Tax=Prolemur simus TaxID=1328070 RepID=A0A8C9DE66_PROSS
MKYLEVTRNSLEKILPQLKCHFTWNLFKKESVSDDLEDRVCNQIEFLNTEFKATMYNLLAYVKHHRGKNEAALECLRQAEELIQREHADQAEIRSLVTWGNYAWVYYHMGRLSEAQIYVDKVKQTCEKFSNPYSIESPELDCEEGWTRLRCGRNERAKVCFEKALEEKPNNPEFSSGLAIAMYRLDSNPQKQFSASALKQAVELSPDNEYRQPLHEGHCNGQECHEKPEDTAVQHCLEGLSISKNSTEKEEMKHKPQNTAENLLPPNAPNSWYLQGLIHKQNGDLQQAAECYEKELGRLLRDAPSGIGNGNEETGLPSSSTESERRERGHHEACDGGCEEQKGGKAGGPHLGLRRGVVLRVALRYIFRELSPHVLSSQCIPAT